MSSRNQEAREESSLAPTAAANLKVELEPLVIQAEGRVPAASANTLLRVGGQVGVAGLIAIAPGVTISLAASRDEMVVVAIVALQLMLLWSVARRVCS
ncbi:hypothetical protein ACQPZ8_47895 [Actinomadura nitritigenes]|uniref:hypothetical protein n=1 Tax=Actinomadura nitritigenes TaxID=134602 RepID=UPI003D934933